MFKFGIIAKKKVIREGFDGKNRNVEIIKKTNGYLVSKKEIETHKFFKKIESAEAFFNELIETHNP